MNTQFTEYVAILDSLKTAVLLVNRIGEIAFINSAAEEFLNISNTQIKGRPLTEIFENKPLIRASFSRLEENSGAIVIKEVALKTDHGQRSIVTLSINPIDDELINGRFFASVEIIAENQYSIIENTASGPTVNLQTSQRLIQGMAHEIKNPLGGIRGAAQLLAANLQNREDKDFINIIVHETDRLTDLVDRMSGYIKDKKMLPLNIHRVLEHVYGLLNSDKPPSVKLKRDYDPSLPEITGSQSSLIQAFINLGLNALQAIDQNGVITMRSRLVFGTIIDNRQYKQTVRVDIQDNGKGIDSAIRNTIFEPLVSSKSNGTGLGLSISREIIAAHDGKIEFSSKPGLTVFSVFLPIEGE